MPEKEIKIQNCKLSDVVTLVTKYYPKYRKFSEKGGH